MYNPKSNQWRSIDSGISRSTPSTTLLPDGRVLIVNGEYSGCWDCANQPTTPQIFDPVSGEIELGSPEPQVTYRGYHSISLLLKDGRIYIGGGVHRRGGKLPMLHIVMFTRSDVRWL